MKIAVLGTGMVGRTIATKLAELGHDVRMGSRTPDNSHAAEWVASVEGSASQGTFADAAAHGEVVFACLNGLSALEALGAAGADNLAGKVLVDVTNPLDFSQGMPPSLFVANTDSLGERIQAAFPRARVVKTLNTVTAPLMVDPRQLPMPTSVFLSGEDPQAKSQVRDILVEWFGWEDVVDLGGIETARGTESWLPLWLRLWGALGTASFNLKIVQGGR